METLLVDIPEEQFDALRSPNAARLPAFQSAGGRSNAGGPVDAVGPRAAEGVVDPNGAGAGFGAQNGAFSVAGVGNRAYLAGATAPTVADEDIDTLVRTVDDVFHADVPIAKLLVRRRLLPVYSNAAVEAAYVFFVTADRATLSVLSVVSGMIMALLVGPSSEGLGGNVVRAFTAAAFWACGAINYYFCIRPAPVQLIPDGPLYAGAEGSQETSAAVSPTGSPTTSAQAVGGGHSGSSEVAVDSPPMGGAGVHHRFSDASSSAAGGTSSASGLVDNSKRADGDIDDDDPDGAPFARQRPYAGRLNELLSALFIFWWGLDVMFRLAVASNSCVSSSTTTRNESCHWLSTVVLCVPVAAILALHVRAVVGIPAMLLYTSCGVVFTFAFPLASHEVVGRTVILYAATCIPCALAMIPLDSLSRRRFETMLRLRRDILVQRKRRTAVMETLGHLLPSSALANLAADRLVSEHSESCVFGVFQIADFGRWTWGVLPEKLALIQYALGRVFDESISDMQVAKMRSVGDQYVVSAGLRSPCLTRTAATRVVAFGLWQLHALDEVWRGLDVTVPVKVGCASGSCSAGFVGLRSLWYEPFGEALDVALAVCRVARKGTVAVDSTTKEWYGNVFSDRRLASVDASVPERTASASPAGSGHSAALGLSVTGDGVAANSSAQNASPRFLHPSTGPAASQSLGASASSMGDSFRNEVSAVAAAGSPAAPTSSSLFPSAMPVAPGTQFGPHVAGRLRPIRCFEVIRFARPGRRQSEVDLGAMSGSGGNRRSFRRGPRNGTDGSGGAAGKANGAPPPSSVARIVRQATRMFKPDETSSAPALGRSEEACPSPHERSDSFRATSQSPPQLLGGSMSVEGQGFPALLALGPTSGDAGSPERGPGLQSTAAFARAALPDDDDGIGEDASERDATLLLRPRYEYLVQCCLAATHSHVIGPLGDWNGGEPGLADALALESNHLPSAGSLVTATYSGSAARASGGSGFTGGGVHRVSGAGSGGSGTGSPGPTAHHRSSAAGQPSLAAIACSGEGSPANASLRGGQPRRGGAVERSIMPSDPLMDATRLAELEEAVTRRNPRWWSLAFADETVEDQFDMYRAALDATEGTLATVVLACFTAAMFVVAISEWRGDARGNAKGTVLLGVALVVLLLRIGVRRLWLFLMFDEPHSIPAWEGFVSLLLVCGLIVGAVLSQVPPSVLNANGSAVSSALCLFAGFGLRRLTWVATFAVTIPVVTATGAALFLGVIPGRHGTFTDAVTFATFGIAVPLFCATHERGSREHFRAQFLVAAVQRAAQTEALLHRAMLRMIVPAFAVDAVERLLLRQDEGGPPRAFLDACPHCCVLHIRLDALPERLRRCGRDVERGLRLIERGFGVIEAALAAALRARRVGQLTGAAGFASVAGAGNSVGGAALSSPAFLPLLPRRSDTCDAFDDDASRRGSQAPWAGSQVLPAMSPPVASAVSLPPLTVASVNPSRAASGVLSPLTASSQVPPSGRHPRAPEIRHPSFGSPRNSSAFDGALPLSPRSSVVESRDSVAAASAAAAAAATATAASAAAVAAAPAGPPICEKVHIVGDTVVIAGPLFAGATEEDSAAAALVLLDTAATVLRLVKRSTAVLCAEEGFTVVVGTAPPSVDVIGPVTRTAVALMNAAPCGAALMSAPFARLLSQHGVVLPRRTGDFYVTGSARYATRGAGVVGVETLGRAGLSLAPLAPGETFGEGEFSASVPAHMVTAPAGLRSSRSVSAALERLDKARMESEHRDSSASREASGL